MDQRSASAFSSRWLSIALLQVAWNHPQTLKHCDVGGGGSVAVAKRVHKWQ
jgi:hypothetical protein